MAGYPPYMQGYYPIPPGSGGGGGGGGSDGYRSDRYPPVPHEWRDRDAYERDYVEYRREFDRRPPSASNNT